MKIKFIQLLNAATMIFPFFSWRKNRFHSSNIIYKIMIFHIPISTLFHLTSAFLNNKSRIVSILQHSDVFLIHLSSVTGTISVIKKLFPCRKILVKFIWLSGILHIRSFIYNIKYDNGNHRSFLLLINTIPVIYKRKVSKKTVFHIILAYKLYHFNNVLIIGHSCFHMILYNIYNDYFLIFK